MKEIIIQEAIKVGKVILEKGDRIKILKEAFQDHKSFLDRVKNLAIATEDIYALMDNNSMTTNMMVTTNIFSGKPKNLSSEIVFDHVDDDTLYNEVVKPLKRMESKYKDYKFDYENNFVKITDKKSV